MPSASLVFDRRVSYDGSELKPFKEVISVLWTVNPLLDAVLPSNCGLYWTFYSSPVVDLTDLYTRISSLDGMLYHSVI